MIDRFRPPLALRILKWAFICAALVVSAELIPRAIPMYLPRDWSSANAGDALADWEGARMMMSGESPYTSNGVAALDHAAMGHPPTTPFSYLLLAESPKAVAAEVTTILLWVILPWLTYITVTQLGFAAPVITTVLASSAIFNLTFVKHHADAVQSSGPIAFLYVLAWAQLRRNRDCLAGVCLGLALTLKLFPGLMLLMLLLARRFRAFAASVVTYLAVAAVMTQAYGLGSWPEYFKQQKGVADSWMGHLLNSSLNGLVLQLLTPACQGQGYPSTRATLISMTCSLVLVGLAAWLTNASFRRARAVDATLIDLPYALFVLLSAFLNAWTWEHYFVIAIQPILILVAVQTSAWRRSLRRWCEYREATRGLVSTSLVTFICAIGTLLAVRASMVDSHQRNDMRDLWFSHHHEFYHRTLHWLQAANFVPWVVPILLCYMVLAISGRSGRKPRDAGLMKSSEVGLGQSVVATEERSLARTTLPQGQAHVCSGSAI
jgi:hypothetical protein